MIKPIDPSPTTLKSLADNQFILLTWYVIMAADYAAMIRGVRITELSADLKATLSSLTVIIVFVLVAATLLAVLRFLHSSVRAMVYSLQRRPWMKKIFKPLDNMDRDLAMYAFSIFVNDIRGYALAHKHQIYWELVKEHERLVCDREESRKLQFAVGILLFCYNVSSFYSLSLFSAYSIPQLALSTLGAYWIYGSLSYDSLSQSQVRILSVNATKEIREWALQHERPPTQVREIDLTTASASNRPPAGGIEEKS